jgi:hypothetical protein
MKYNWITLTYEYLKLRYYDAVDYCYFCLQYDCWTMEQIEESLGFKINFEPIDNPRIWGTRRV